MISVFIEQRKIPGPLNGTYTWCFATVSSGDARDLSRPRAKHRRLAPTKLSWQDKSFRPHATTFAYSHGMAATTNLAIDVQDGGLQGDRAPNARASIDENVAPEVRRVVSPSGAEPRRLLSRDPSGANALRQRSGPETRDCPVRSSPARGLARLHREARPSHPGNRR